MLSIKHMFASFALSLIAASQAAADGDTINDGMVNLKTACAKLETVDERAYCARSMVLVSETLVSIADHFGRMGVPQRILSDGEMVVVIRPSAFNRLKYQGVNIACDDIGTVKFTDRPADHSVNLTDGAKDALHNLAKRAITCSDVGKEILPFSYAAAARHLQRHAETVLLRTQPPMLRTPFEIFVIK